MKKLFTLAMMAICFSTMAQSSFTTLVPDFYTRAMFHLQYGSQITEGVNANYAYLSNYQGSLTKDNVQDLLCVISKDGNSCEQTQINVPQDYKIFEGVEGDGEYVAFYSSYNKKSKKFALSINKMSVDGGTGSWNPEEFVSYTCEKRDANFVETAVSPNKQKVAVLLSAADKKNAFKGMLLTVFDNQGNQLWQNEIDIDFSAQTFGVLDMAMTDNGTIYLAIGAYQQPNNKTRTNETIHFYEITDNNVNDFVQNVTFGFISNGKLLISKSGDIVMGGYYKTDVKENESGSYICRFNPKSSGFESIDNKEFEGYTNKGGKGAVGNNIADDVYWVTVQEIFEFENGNIVLLGEQQYAAVYTTTNNGSQTTTYKYWAKNIMYNTVSADGKITGFDMFAKNQVAACGIPSSQKKMGISYSAFMQDNQIRIVFADNYNNYHGKSNQMLTRILSSKEAAVMLTIDGENKDDVKILFDTKVSKNWLEHPLFSTDDGFVLITRNGKKESVNKVTIQ